jgi:hypothetical protein
MKMDINQLTSSIDQRLIPAGRSMLLLSGENGMLLLIWERIGVIDCSVELYEVDVNCVATVEQREREERRNGGACSGPSESRAQLWGFYSIPPELGTVGDHPKTGKS